MTTLTTGSISLDFQVVRNEGGVCTLHIKHQPQPPPTECANAHNHERANSHPDTVICAPMALMPLHLGWDGNGNAGYGDPLSLLDWSWDNATAQVTTGASTDTRSTDTRTDMSADIAWADIDPLLMSAHELEEIKNMEDSDFDGLFDDELDEKNHQPPAPTTKAAAPTTTTTTSGRDDETSGGEKETNGGEKEDDSSDSSDSSDDDHSSDDDDESDDEAAMAPQSMQNTTKKRPRNVGQPPCSAVLAPRNVLPTVQVPIVSHGCSKCRFNKRGCNGPRCNRLVPTTDGPKKKFRRCNNKHPSQTWSSSLKQ